MTIQEVLHEITSTPKWYIGKLKHSNASHLKRRIGLGKCKPNTIKSFFNKFGYDGEFNEWYKDYSPSDGYIKLELKTPDQIKASDEYQKLHPNELIIPK